MNNKILVLFTLNTFISMEYSIVAPLFPVFGKKLSLSENILGGIISLYSLAYFFITPFTPQLIYKIGRKKLFYLTNIIEASSTIIYGFLIHINNYYCFIIITFIIRIIHGISGGIISTLLYSIGVSISSQEEIFSTLGYLEIAWSVGVSIGQL